MKSRFDTEIRALHVTRRALQRKQRVDGLSAFEASELRAVLDEIDRLELAEHDETSLGWWIKADELAEMLRQWLIAEKRR